MDCSRPPCCPPSGFVEPCLPTLARVPPAGPAWVHEIKHDGFRLMVWRDGERVRAIHLARLDAVLSVDRAFGAPYPDHAIPD
jgi:hypothetical protein